MPLDLTHDTVVLVLAVCAFAVALRWLSRLPLDSSSDAGAEAEAVLLTDEQREELFEAPLAASEAQPSDEPEGSEPEVSMPEGSERIIVLSRRGLRRFVVDGTYVLSGDGSLAPSSSEWDGAILHGYGRGNYVSERFDAEKGIDVEAIMASALEAPGAIRIDDQGRRYVSLG